MPAGSLSRGLATPYPILPDAAQSAPVGRRGCLVMR